MGSSSDDLFLNPGLRRHLFPRNQRRRNKRPVPLRRPLDEKPTVERRGGVDEEWGRLRRPRPVPLKNPPPHPRGDASPPTTHPHLPRPYVILNDLLNTYP